MSRLSEIIAHKRTEIEPWVEHTADWRERAKKLAPFRGFKKSLAGPSFGFVAEVKKGSPSAGVIVENFDPVKTAITYDTADANCISVLTDEKYFHGHLDYLALVRNCVERPLLRKDFTLHEVQIYQAALAGADAILLIVGALDDQELSRLMKAADDCAIDTLVEVHDEPELKRALDVGATFIGINNRNLATFEVDLRTTETLAPKIPSDCVVISESGIRSVEDIRRVVGAGVHAALIGESLMRAEDPRGVLESYRKAAELERSSGVGSRTN
jgi:indole-3-glycerol phosphate synthase